jgi:hypothetical protein
VTTTTYLGSGDASRHRRDYRPDWLDNLADDVTMEGHLRKGFAKLGISSRKELDTALLEPGLA